MKRLVINALEKVIVQDINDLQKAVHQSVYDGVLYHFLQRQDGFLGTSFTPSFVDATHVSLQKGRAYIYDAAQTGYQPKYRAINSDAAVSAVITAAHATLNRIDLICIKSNEAVTATATRSVKSAGPPVVISSQTVDKVSENTYTLNVVAGTAAASPAVPATPTGYIAIARVLVTAAVGVSGAGSITDVRNILLPAVNTTPYADRYVSPSGNGTDLTLASAIAALPSGGLIVVMESITLSATHTLPANTTLIGRGFGATITLGASGKIELGDNCAIRDLSLYTAQTSGTMVEFVGSYGVIEHCKFAMPVTSTGTAVKFTGSLCHVGQCYFAGVVTPSTGSALEFALGSSDNTHQNNVFTV